MRKLTSFSWGQTSDKSKLYVGTTRGLCAVSATSSPRLVGKAVISGQFLLALYQWLSTAKLRFFTLLSRSLYPQSTGPTRITTNYINLLLIGSNGGAV